MRRARSLSKSEVSFTFQGLNKQVKPFLCLPMDHARFLQRLSLNATDLHGRLGPNMQVVSRAMVVVIAIHALVHREVMGIAVGVSGPAGFWRQFLGLLQGAQPGGACSRCAARRAETNRQLPISIELVDR